MGGIGAGPHDHEVVPGDLAPLAAMSLGDELVLRFGIVNQHDVGVAARRRRQRLAGALRDDPHGDAGFRGEFRQDVVEQSGILQRRRRRHDDRLGADVARDRREQRADGEDRKPPAYVHRLPPEPRANAVALTATLMPIRTKPSPRASDRLPLLVSSAIAVVMVRV